MRTALVLAAVTVGAVAVPRPAAAVSFWSESAHASASYTGTGVEPFVGDFDGDGQDDVFFYRPGTASETVKFGQTDETFVTSGKSTFQVSGTYQPITGFFEAGDDATDILWYAPGPAADYLWRFQEGGAKVVTKLTINGTYQPLVGDWDSRDAYVDDIFWYAPGPAGDSLWSGDGDGTFTSIPQSVKGNFIPLVGGFTPNLDPGVGGSVDDHLDIFWYAPGTAADSLWNGAGDGTFTKIPKTVNGTYRPFVAYLDGYGVDDIFWYSPTGSDAVWLGDPDTGAQTSHAASIGSGFTPIADRFRIPVEPVYWWSPTGADVMWFPEGEPGTWEYTTSTEFTDMGAGYLPVTGDFDGSGRNDIYWIGPGGLAERLFWNTTFGPV